MHPNKTLPAVELAHSEFIFSESPTPACHAATIAQTPHGLVAAWFGGKRECFPDVGIWLSRLEPSGTWSTPVEVVNGIQHTTEDGSILRYASWNPVLFQQKNGAELVLFYKVGKTPQTWWGMMTTSIDGGKSWAIPIRLPDGIYGPIKNKPIELPCGTWLCPSSTEESVFTGWRVHFERSADKGRTWVRSLPVNDGIEFGAIQPSILIHPEGRLQAIGRSQLAKRVFSTWSEDGGHHWSDISFLDVPNPDSGTDATTLQDGTHALIHNPTEEGRSPLSLSLSTDGIHWQRVLDIETEPGEYSYPSILQSDDGNIHIVYTWRRKLIKHVVIRKIR